MTYLDPSEHLWDAPEENCTAGFLPDFTNALAAEGAQTPTAMLQNWI